MIPSKKKKKKKKSPPVEVPRRDALAEILRQKPGYRYFNSGGTRERERPRAEAQPAWEFNPSTMGSDDFVAAVREKADLGDGYLVTSTHNKFNDNYDSAHIAFYNVPKDVGREAGGAVAFNNRLLMFVDGFGKEKNEPSPKGKVKFRVGAAELLPRDMRPRGKTSSPERMVDYVAGIITEASKLPSVLPPGSSRAANPAPPSASDLVGKLKF